MNKIKTEKKRQQIFSPKTEIPKTNLKNSFNFPPNRRSITAPVSLIPKKYFYSKFIQSKY